MLAKDLRPGDLFTVDPPDFESPVRRCITNDATHGVRFGWPNNEEYWCAMGGMCPVVFVGSRKVTRCLKCDNCRNLMRVRERVLACCNPPFSHADQDVVDLWNAELLRLKCTNPQQGEECPRCEAINCEAYKPSHNGKGQPACSGCTHREECPW